MDFQSLANIKTRTDAKLRYAEIILNELKKNGGHGGTDFDRAYQEAFLFHLLGAKEAFLSELNFYYAVGVPERDISPGKIRDALKKRGLESTELAELYCLGNNQKSWLFHAKEMRDHSAHVAEVPRAYHMGGPDNGKVFLRNPATLETVDLHVPDALSEWLDNMTTLLECLRVSAITNLG